MSHNALQHYPECHGAYTWGGTRQVQLGGYPYPIMLCNITQNFMGQIPRGGTQPGPAGEGGTLPGQDGGVPCWGGTPGYPHSRVSPSRIPPGRVPPSRVPPPGQVRGYPVRTTEGVLTTRRAVCLLRSRRRTFFFILTSIWVLCGIFRYSFNSVQFETEICMLCCALYSTPFYIQVLSVIYCSQKMFGESV